MGAEASGLAMAMGNANLLLFLLLSVTICQAGEPKLMSLVGNERYVQDNDLTSINETSCTGIEFHDYDNYADYCDPKYDGEDPKTRYMRRLMMAYSIPAAITLLTLIVELAAPHCAAAKPNFGVKSCHFYGGVGKFVWLYLPILLLLIINTAMFVFIAVNIFKNHSANKKGSRSEKVDTMCIYLRLFLGMGIIWYFEILAFALTSYKLNANIFILTDTLNMCQGVWAFIIFVCKRNVVKVVRGKSSRLYSIARQMSRQMSLGGGSQGGKVGPRGTL